LFASIIDEVGSVKVTRPKVAIYNLYWATYGGGEQVSGAIAEALKTRCDVTLLGPEEPQVEAFRARLGVDLSGCAWRKVVDDTEAGEASADFDVFINGTYRSHSVNQAPVGLYYVHFPEPPITSRRQTVDKIARVGLGAMKAASRLPARLAGVQRGLQRRVIDQSWSQSYTKFLSNSTYTAGWVKKLWDADSEIVYPPVRTTVKAGKKVELITSIGRFFDPSLGHSKKQRELLEAFTRMFSSREGVGSWKLSFVGGADGASREYALAIRRGAIGLPVAVHLNAPREIVETTLATASIYWHGGGFGEDAELHPERFEHFGIAVVEAMAAGAVPVVFAAAGPAEIVRHAVDGFHWKTLDELQAYTRVLMNDEGLRSKMSASAQERAAEFGVDVFAARINSLI
jgi:glycosyltransferase involved in cell wall biosynthesis